MNGARDRRWEVSHEMFCHTVKLLDTALRAAGGERDCDERLRHAQEKDTEARQLMQSR